MSYLIDTDWVVEYLKGREPVVTVLPQLRHDGLAISLITFGEIYEGIYAGHDRDQHEAIFWRFLRRVNVLSLNKTILRHFARIRSQLRALLIAATAIYYDLTLLTHNTRHFSRIPNLKLYQMN
jgi:tRNA(fMet)-specific endonuclease VapC